MILSKGAADGLWYDDSKRTGYRHACERGVVVFLCFIDFVSYVKGKVMILMSIGSATVTRLFQCLIKYPTTAAFGSTWC